MVKATVDAHADRAILPTSAILLAAMQEFGRPDAARLPLRARRSRVGAVGAGRSHAACRDCSLGVRCDGLLSLWSRNENKTIKGRRMILLECENCRRRFAVQEAPALTRLLCPYCAKEIIVQSSQRTVDLEAKDDDNSASAPQDLPQSSPACLHAPPRNGSVENARPFLSFLDDYDRGQSPFAKQYRAEQNAWLAALLSLFSGVCLGQFYNGQVLKGVCILALSVTVQFALVIFGENYLLMAAALAAVVVGSSIDAFVSAVRINHYVPDISGINRSIGRGDGQAAEQQRETAPQHPPDDPADSATMRGPGPQTAERINNPRK